MLEFFQKGGPVMYLILLASVIGLAVIIERFWHLHRAKIDTNKFMENISNTLKRNRIMEAVELCEQTPGPIAHILKAGILKHDRNKQEIKEAIEDAGLHEIPRLEKSGHSFHHCQCGASFGASGDGDGNGARVSDNPGKSHSAKSCQSRRFSRRHLGSAYYHRIRIGGGYTRFYSL